MWPLWLFLFLQITMFFLSMANRPFTIGADTQIFLGYNLLVDTFSQVFLFHFALLYYWVCVIYDISGVDDNTSAPTCHISSILLPCEEL